MIIRVAIYCGEHERFGPNLPDSLLGQTTKEGWLVVGTEPENDQKIWLTLQKDE